MPPYEPSISLSQGPFHPAIVNPASLTESQLECSDTRHEVVTGRVQTSSQSIVSNRGRIRWNKVTSFGGLPKLSTQKLGSSIPQIAKVCGSLKMFDTLTRVLQCSLNRFLSHLLHNALKVRGCQNQLWSCPAQCPLLESATKAELHSYSRPKRRWG